ncbi:conserved hypothetical protein [Trichinella spiralis]|uniref:hypothetical protein n=1 Tax=Trichinella spiralis TaxID=6334 RepID=UPI0001EFD0DF|nr:conserved hypothetical protein [Trichinella spiralis]
MGSVEKKIGKKEQNYISTVPPDLISLHSRTGKHMSATATSTAEAAAAAASASASALAAALAAADIPLTNVEMSKACAGLLIAKTMFGIVTFHVFCNFDNVNLIFPKATN